MYHLQPYLEVTYMQEPRHENLGVYTSCMSPHNLEANQPISLGQFQVHPVQTSY